MITVLIAEDDPAMCHVLGKTLSEIPGVEVLGEAGDGITALTMVEKLNPQVVFIDIDLPGKNGLELAREICDVNPQTILIFATAYADYTHEAFQVYAYDYLVKPFKLDRIKKTMEKIKQQDQHRATTPIIQNPPAKSAINSTKLIVKDKEKLIFVDTQEINFITREKRKTVIVTNNEDLNITESLDGMEARLAGNTFYRSHRSYIINLNLVKEIRPWGKNSYEIAFAGTPQTAILTASKMGELKKAMDLYGDQKGLR